MGFCVEIIVQSPVYCLNTEKVNSFDLVENTYIIQKSTMCLREFRKKNKFAGFTLSHHLKTPI